ncbi:pirin family protein [Saccharospirillum salsuginis]|uniref:Quercetin 2,3-dioxygenase n=1 Tax=Saccharospirillum salsuginis TaxID=418750 RepID=A0A918KM77_9GAMM|nr:pirin family protein [Saccharospirillum salsuginis]GGX68678.1 hypothetical protein GCM10007392_40370 [Saccharospirillum salsuginis]
MKQIQAVFSPPQGHWVGDGFPVRSLMSYNRMGADAISPFLLLDYAGPARFAPSHRQRGVGEHPHRGFETVTLVLQGELEHRDSSGEGGRIGEGDVQWMTAGAGIVHEELHSRAFTETGGVLEMVQLWVNLPAASKDTPPGYQTLLSADIPVVDLDEAGSRLRVIAGDYAGRTGPARTFSPVSVWDVALAAGADITLPVVDGHTTLVAVLDGSVTLNGTEITRKADMACFGREGDSIRLEADASTRLLILGGEPIDEPVVGHGPFVMNSHEDIHQALTDFHLGKFGRLS